MKAYSFSYEYHDESDYSECDSEIKRSKLPTNEEWFSGLTTGEKAEFLSDMVQEAIKVYDKHGTTWHEAVMWWDGWLKEEHHEM